MILSYKHAQAEATPAEPEQPEVQPTPETNADTAVQQATQMSGALATSTAQLNQMVRTFAKEVWGVDLTQAAAMKIVHKLVADMSNQVSDQVAGGVLDVIEAWQDANDPSKSKEARLISARTLEYLASVFWNEETEEQARAKNRQPELEDPATPEPTNTKPQTSGPRPLDYEAPESEREIWETRRRLPYQASVQSSLVHQKAMNIKQGEVYYFIPSNGLPVKQRVRVDTVAGDKFQGHAVDVSAQGHWIDHQAPVSGSVYSLLNYDGLRAVN
jgi:hypothetical protein